MASPSKRRASSSVQASTYRELFDEDHADEEDRFIAIGPIQRGLVLVVWTEREGDVIRIISARWASRTEQKLFRSHFRRPT